MSKWADIRRDATRTPVPPYYGELPYNEPEKPGPLHFYYSAGYASVEIDDCNRVVFTGPPKYDPVWNPGAPRAVERRPFTARIRGAKAIRDYLNDYLAYMDANDGDWDD